METRSDGNEDIIATIKDMRQQLESRIETQHTTHLDLLASLQTLVPNVVSSIDVSLKVVSFFNNRPFTPTPVPPPKPKPIANRIPKRPLEPTHLSSSEPHPSRRSIEPKPKNLHPDPSPDEKFTIDESGSPLTVVRSMVAVCLLQRVPFSAIDSSTVLRKLENDQTATPAEKAALRELGGESGAILAVEMALRSMAEDNGGVELEEFVIDGKSRVMVLGIDRTRLLKELPESAQYQQQQDSILTEGNQNQQTPSGSSDVNGAGYGIGGSMPRPMQDLWLGPGDPHLSVFPPGSMMGPRGSPRVMGMMGMPRGMGVSPLHRPPFGSNAPIANSNAVIVKPSTEEDGMKHCEALLSKPSFREMQKSKTGAEISDLIHRPTARESAAAAKFKSKGGPNVKYYCSALTKEDCRRQSGSFTPCEKTDGLIFLWVTGHAMELGRECLELWGYKRVEEIIWVKTNQLQRIIRTGRTGHWLNHSKEHCLVGIKGNPEVNRNIDTDVIVAEVRETSRKPDEMYPLLERISPRTRKLELFARMHNTHAGWMSLGNQLSGVRLVDEGLRARYKAAYPEVVVEPSSPPKASVMEMDSTAPQMKSPFVGMESKSMEPVAPEPAYSTEQKPMALDVEMVS